MYLCHYRGGRGHTVSAEPGDHTSCYYYAPARKKGAVSVAFVRLFVRPSVRRVHSE